MNVITPSTIYAFICSLYCLAQEHTMIIMILQIQFTSETSIAKSIAIGYAVLKKVLLDTDSNITLEKYCNTDSDAGKSIGDTRNSDNVLQY